MMSELSSGGVVIFGNALLLLRKYNGDWVLPKGRVEAGERLYTTALREVLEESGVKAEIIQYIGRVNYHYKNLKEYQIFPIHIPDDFISNILTEINTNLNKNIRQFTREEIQYLTLKV